MVTFSQPINAWVSINSGIVERYLKRPRTWKNVFDEVLGEGEFGIVYKGCYSGKDGNITDVAVKKINGKYTKSKCLLVNS